MSIDTATLPLSDRYSYASGAQNPTEAVSFRSLLQTDPDAPQPVFPTAPYAPVNPLGALDIDGDGALSVFEIDTWREIVQGDLQRFEAGEDVPAEENIIPAYKAFVEQLNSLSPEVSNESILLREFDTDADGALSDEEIAQAKTYLQTTVNTLVDNGGEKALYVHAQQLIAALNAITASREESATETVDETSGLPLEDTTTDGTDVTPASSILDIDGDGLLSAYEVDTWKSVTDEDVANFSGEEGSEEQTVLLDKFQKFSEELDTITPDLGKGDLLVAKFDANQNGLLSEKEVSDARTLLRDNIAKLNQTGAERTQIVHSEKILSDLDAVQNAFAAAE